MTSPVQPAARRGRSGLSRFHRTKLVFLVAAFLSFVLSVSLWFLVDREVGKDD